jgi:Leucine-rich repeat (LRR) protein
VKLEKLKSLDLSHNPITCIPGAVSQISSLTTLRIDSTTLPYFPVSVCALSKIEELTCSGHKWGVFPEQLLQFAELRWLNLAANGIANIHAEIGKLTNLTYPIQHVMFESMYCILTYH